MLSWWSHVTVSLFAEWSAWSPPGNFVSGHSLTICDIVCLLPQAHSGASLMHHACREAAQIPWPARYRLSIVQSLRLRSNPGWQEVGSVIKNWLGISCLAQSSFQASCKSVRLRYSPTYLVGKKRVLACPVRMLSISLDIQRTHAKFG